MNKEINLIADKRQQVVAKERHVTIARFIAGGMSALVVISAIVLFILNQNSPLNDLNQQSRLITASLDLFRPKIASILLINERLRNISIIMQARSSFETQIDTILQQVPQDVTVTAFNITKKNLSLGFSSSSLSSLNTVLDNMTKLVTGKVLLKRIVINGITFDPKAGKYVVTIDGDLL